MTALAIILLFNLITWSILFFIVRKIYSPTIVKPKKQIWTYAGDRSSRALPIMPFYLMSVLLVVIVLFAPSSALGISDRVNGLVFIAVAFLGFLYLLKNLGETRRR